MFTCVDLTVISGHRIREVRHDTFGDILTLSPCDFSAWVHGICYFSIVVLRHSFSTRNSSRVSANVAAGWRHLQRVCQSAEAICWHATCLGDVSFVGGPAFVGQTFYLKILLLLLLHTTGTAVTSNTVHLLLHCVWKKRGHVIFNYNSGISWSIFIIFVPLKTGMNTLQLCVIYLLKCLITS